MIAYASRTGTRRNLAALRAAGWRLMISARGVLRHEGFRYCLDNGAWTAFAKGEPFDEGAFALAYERFAAAADFVVLPDIVAGGLRSLDFSLEWRERLGTPACPLMLAVQDGMTVGDIRQLVGPELGIFIGGTTEWKEANMRPFIQAAKENGAQAHVARVNSMRRIYLCITAGADSFDGSSASRYAVTLPNLDHARHQLDLML